MALHEMLRMGLPDEDAGTRKPAWRSYEVNLKGLLCPFRKTIMAKRFRRIILPLYESKIAAEVRMMIPFPV